MTAVFSILFLMTFLKFGLAADIVLTVNPTQVEAMRHDAVVLDCQANKNNSVEFISKPVIWKHVANDGTIHKITIGFNLDEGANKTKYEIDHREAETNYSFKLKILRVGDEDDGKYICEHKDANLITLSSVEVPFTVLNPVEKVRIEVVTVVTCDRMCSDSQIMANSDINTVKEGEFEVTCTAEGSNPSPQMTLKVNDDVQYSDTTIEKSFVGNRPYYKGNFTKRLSFSAYKCGIQTVECSAGIPRKQFPDKSAGLKLKDCLDSAAVVVKPLGILLCILLALFVRRISSDL
ncbi:hypothetical protein ACJMK2_023870 [Sinanodonta woodiana]|uniref:Immunoglobulin domain-containing protein n=1 Tax=Sinanodonta woodiana TaxID=1069815 RepID=A0ABD3T5N1_SINWO